MIFPKATGAKPYLEKKLDRAMRNTGRITFSAGFIGISILLLIFFMELKRVYELDVIPGYDSSVDDYYGAIRGTLYDFFIGKD